MRVSKWWHFSFWVNYLFKYLQKLCSINFTLNVFTCTLLNYLLNFYPSNLCEAVRGNNTCCWHDHFWMDSSDSGSPAASWFPDTLLISPAHWLINSAALSSCFKGPSQMCGIQYLFSFSQALICLDYSLWSLKEIVHVFICRGVEETLLRVSHEENKHLNCAKTFGIFFAKY